MAGLPPGGSAAHSLSPAKGAAHDTLLVRTKQKRQDPNSMWR